MTQSQNDLMTVHRASERSSKMHLSYSFSWLSRHSWKLRTGLLRMVEFVLVVYFFLGEVAHPHPCTLLLLLSRFSHVQLCVTPQTAAYLAPLSLGFSRQEHWSGFPFPPPMHENEVAQSCPTLRDPMDCTLPGSSVHGILQARVLEWVPLPSLNDTAARKLFTERSKMILLCFSFSSEGTLFFLVLGCTCLLL